MKNFGIFFVLIIFCASVKSDYWSDFEDSFKNFEKEMEEKGRRMEEEGRRMEEEAEKMNKYWEKQSALMEQEQEKAKLKQNEILNTAILIEKGQAPVNVKSNTTSFTTISYGRPMTIKSTIFSLGDDKKGETYSVQSVYEGSVINNWSITTNSWNNNGAKKSNEFTNRRTTSYINNNSNYEIINNGGSTSYVQNVPNENSGKIIINGRIIN
ncbi:uncharacterized protein LOC127290529 isoform X3 [Leptopilina boulardi]|uniref:uncharacterized protein LOC127290529 isoform X3 n=1 Tax=Leptopilina boulardi TaxID=63433 RepID=UPI0021F632B2|nr:uncharacterized protein LOC127290529 isoform X3 [Leptopilina boulardi]